MTVAFRQHAADELANPVVRGFYQLADQLGDVGAWLLPVTVPREVDVEALWLSRGLLELLTDYAFDLVCDFFVVQALTPTRTSRA